MQAFRHHRRLVRQTSGDQSGFTASLNSSSRLGRDAAFEIPTTGECLGKLQQKARALRSCGFKRLFWAFTMLLLGAILSAVQFSNPTEGCDHDSGIQGKADLSPCWSLGSQEWWPYLFYPLGKPLLLETQICF